MVVTVTPAVEIRRFTRVEYQQLIETIFQPGERLELIDGLLVLREPQYTPHATAIQLVQRTLQRAFGDGWSVRSQLPIALDDMSEPEPDAAVVPGDPRDYRDAHPERPVLIVEVSQSRLAFDRRHKASLYARAGIADYWVVNLVDQVLEVYREPVAAPTGRGDWKYNSVRLLRRNAIVTPLAAPRARIRVAALLP